MTPPRGTAITSTRAHALGEHITLGCPNILILLFKKSQLLVQLLRALNELGRPSLRIAKGDELLPVVETFGQPGSPQLHILKFLSVLTMRMVLVSGWYHGPW